MKVFSIKILTTKLLLIRLVEKKTREPTGSAGNGAEVWII